MDRLHNKLRKLSIALLMGASLGLASFASADVAKYIDFRGGPTGYSSDLPGVSDIFVHNNHYETIFDGNMATAFRFVTLKHGREDVYPNHFTGKMTLLRHELGDDRNLVAVPAVMFKSGVIGISIRANSSVVWSNADIATLIKMLQSKEPGMWDYYGANGVRITDPVSFGEVAYIATKGQGK